MQDKTRSIIIIIATAILAIAVAIYYCVDPENEALAPKCIMFVLTGYQCPSCGIQRFIHHLLHGEFLTAIRYNYLLIIFLPYVLLSIFSELLFYTNKYRQFARGIMHKIYSAKVLKAYLFIYFSWWILRNILGV